MGRASGGFDVDSQSIPLRESCGETGVQADEAAGLSLVAIRSPGQARGESRGRLTFATQGGNGHRSGRRVDIAAPRSEADAYFWRRRPPFHLNSALVLQTIQRASGLGLSKA